MADKRAIKQSAPEHNSKSTIKSFAESDIGTLKGRTVIKLKIEMVPKINIPPVTIIFPLTHFRYSGVPGMRFFIDTLLRGTGDYMGVAEFFAHNVGYSSGEARQNREVSSRYFFNRPEEYFLPTYLMQRNSTIPQL